MTTICARRLAKQLVMSEEFDVFEAGTGAQAMERAKESLYDLVILDVGLPDTDGRELCRLMRKQGVKCPILMLTGHDSDADTILGLDAGANDYVTKPFRFPVSAGPHSRAAAPARTIRGCGVPSLVPTRSSPP